MYQGQVSKLSEGSVITAASSIAPLFDITRLTGTTSIATIVPPPNVLDSGGVIICLIPTGGAVGLTTGGNIAAAVTMPNLKPTFLVYSGTTDLWYPQISA